MFKKKPHAPEMIPQEFRRRVVFATPSSSFSLCREFFHSSLMCDRMLVAMNIGASYIGLDGDCYLSKVRSKLATKFLEDYPDADSLFFIDDDVGFPPGKAVEFILRNEEVVAGVYPKKSENIDFPCVLLGDKSKNGAPIMSNGLVAASMVPTGFLRIKRSALEKIAANSRKFWTVHDADITKQRLYSEIFKMGVDRDGGDWVGEDPWFCRECISLGIDIWVDPDIQFTHRGSRKWTASLNDYLGQDMWRVAVNRDPQAEAAE